jgi:phosphohistidine phosphatase SixA
MQKRQTLDPGERLRLSESNRESGSEHHDPQLRRRYEAPGTHPAFHWYHGGMTRNNAQLQHRPFLMPIWLSVLAALVVMCFLGFEVWIWATADSTTIIVVRHAEKELGSGDPPLSSAGQARAELLAGMFGDVRAPGHIDAIYVSPTVRSQMTAAPLAARLGLTPIVAPPHDARSLARRVLHEHSGGRVLVVGHSDTVPEIVKSLTGAKGLPPIGEAEYGTMYIVTAPRVGRADFLRLSY